MINTFLNKIKQFLWKIDLFSSSQLLRYKNQTSYSTLTGGIVSLLIILVFGTILIQNSISVFTFSSVNAQDFTYYVQDPTYTSFTFDNQSNFIFGVGINGLNLSDSRRYFDITLASQQFSKGKKKNITNYKLKPCQYNQWAHINQQGAVSFNNSHLDSYLCPDSGFTVQLQGKYTSNNFKLLVLKISKCNNETDPNRPCVDQSIINKSTTYTVDFYFMNAYVNNADIQPVNYYLQDRNYFVFNTDSTIDSNLYLTQNIITTDQSLFPWDNIQNHSVLVVKQIAQVKPSPLVINQYVSIHLRKSPYYIYSKRSFQKLVDLLSNIGGLFGFAVTFFIFIQNYTEASFQIQMGDKLFYYSQSDPLNSNGFNFFYYIGYLFYELLKIFGIDVPWKQINMYYQCRQEIGQQLDLSLLMNKITFLQKCMNVIFQQHQFRAIFLQQKPNVKQAQILRINHGLNKIIHKNSKKINNKIQYKVKQHHQKLRYRKSQTQQRKNIAASSRQSQLQQKSSSADHNPSKEQKIPFDLMQIVANFILNDPRLSPDKQSLKQSNKMSIIIEQSSKAHEQIKQQIINVEQIAGDNHQSVKFVNTALKDIELIQRQSKNGNKLSQRIYNQLNNDITKQQLIILKCLQTIISHQKQNSDQENKKGIKPSIFQNLLKLTTLKQQQKGLEIILESNNRIKIQNDI